MRKSPIKTVIKLILIPVAIGIAVLLLTWLAAYIYAIPKVYTVDDVPAKRVAIVLGAGLQRDGGPSAVLRDRVATAAQLYFAGKVEKLLMSGDNRFVYYNEPGAMREYALSLGVPEEDIVLDYAGRRTYDTCYRARDIFQVSEAIIVTQKFHLPRALMICNGLGLPTVGVAADQRVYQGTLFWTIREFPAIFIAVFDTFITKPLPVLGDIEPIFPTPDAGAQSGEGATQGTGSGLE